MESVVHPPWISFRVWKITVFGVCTVSYTCADQISTCETLTPPIFMFQSALGRPMTEDDFQFLYGELSKLGRFTGIDLLRMLA